MSMNVKMNVNNHTLTIEIDLTCDFGPSKSGKTHVIGTTQGFVTLPAPFEDASINLNVVKRV